MHRGKNPVQIPVQSSPVQSPESSFYTDPYTCDSGQAVCRSNCTTLKNIAPSIIFAFPLPTCMSDVLCLCIFWSMYTPLCTYGMCKSCYIVSLYNAHGTCTIFVYILCVYMYLCTYLSKCIFSHAGTGNSTALGKCWRSL